MKASVPAKLAKVPLILEILEETKMINDIQKQQILEDIKSGTYPGKFAGEIAVER